MFLQFAARTIVVLVSADICLAIGDRLAVPIAGNFAFKGDLDSAMSWLNRAYAQGDPQLSLVAIHPAHDNLQGDPRFQAFIRKLNLSTED